MPSSTRYPDALRQQAIALYRQGKGYKAIASALGLSRDTVRNWISSYRLTGRTESVQTTGQLRNGPSYQKREERFAAAREEYETSSASLLAIAQKHGLNYNNLRNYLLSNHPESALLHAYAKKSAKMQQVMDAQMAAIRQQGEEYLAQMREELTVQLQRLHRTG
jgi:transposase-like protein